jgi:hypothetical protein
MSDTNSAFLNFLVTSRISHDSHNPDFSQDAPAPRSELNSDSFVPNDFHLPRKSHSTSHKKRLPLASPSALPGSRSANSKLRSTVATIINDYTTPNYDSHLIIVKQLLKTVSNPSELSPPFLSHNGQHYKIPPVWTNLPITTSSVLEQNRHTVGFPHREITSAASLAAAMWIAKPSSAFDKHAFNSRSDMSSHLRARLKKAKKDFLREQRSAQLAAPSRLEKRSVSQQNRGVGKHAGYTKTSTTVDYFTDTENIPFTTTQALFKLLKPSLAPCRSLIILFRSFNAVLSIFPALKTTKLTHKEAVAMLSIGYGLHQSSRAKIAPQPVPSAPLPADKPKSVSTHPRVIASRAAEEAALLAADEAAGVDLTHQVYQYTSPSSPLYGYQMFRNSVVTSYLNQGFQLPVLAQMIEKYCVRLVKVTRNGRPAPIFSLNSMRVAFHSVADVITVFDLERIVHNLRAHTSGASSSAPPQEPPAPPVDANGVPLPPRPFGPPLDPLRPGGPPPAGNAPVINDLNGAAPYSDVFIRAFELLGQKTGTTELASTVSSAYQRAKLAGMDMLSPVFDCLTVLTDSLKSIFNGIGAPPSVLYDLIYITVGVYLAYSAESAAVKMIGVAVAGLRSAPILMRLFDKLTSMYSAHSVTSDVIGPIESITEAVRAVLGMSIDKDKLTAAAKQARDYTAIFTGVSKVIAFSAALFVFVMPPLYRWVTGRSWNETADSRNFKTLNELLAVSELLHTTSPDDTKTLAYIESLQKVYRELPHEGVKYDRVPIMYAKALKNFSLYYGELSGKHTRILPVSIMFTGLPGQGKSVCTLPIARALNRLLMRNEYDIYYPTPDSPFHDTYHNQAVCVIDDFLQTADAQTIQRSALDWFNSVGNLPLPLNMAHLEHKGSTYFNSPFVITSTNRSVDSVCSTLTSPEAMRRRIHIHLSLEHLSHPNTPMSHRFRVTTLDGTCYNTSMSLAEVVHLIWTQHLAHKQFNLAGTNYTDDFDAHYPPTVVDPVATGLSNAAADVLSAHSKVDFGDLNPNDLETLPEPCCNNLTLKLKCAWWKLCYPLRYFRRVATRAEEVTDNFFRIADSAATAIKVVLASCCATLLTYLGFMIYRWATATTEEEKPSLIFHTTEATSSATSRTVPKRPLRPQRPLHFETTHAHSSIDQLPNVTKNVVPVSIAGSHHFATFLKGRSFVTVSHSYLGNSSPTISVTIGATTFNFVCHDYQITVLRDLDLIYVTLPNKDSHGNPFPEFKDISSYLFNAELLHGSGSVPAYRVFPSVCMETSVDLQRQCLTYYHDDSDRTILGMYLLTSPSSSMPGYCGAPFVSVDSHDGKCLLGIIVAGSAHHTCIRTISHELALELFKKHSAPLVAHSRTLVPVTEGKFDMGQDAMFNIVINDQVQHISTIPSGHGFEPNPRADSSLIDPFCPAPLSGKFASEGIMKTPLEIACGKFQRPPPKLQFPRALIQEVTHDVFQRLLGNPTDTRLKPLSPSEAYWGTDSVPGFDPNSSLGYPLKKDYRNHRALQEAFPDRTLLPMPLVDCLEDLYEGNFAFYPFCGSLKTEVIDAAKAEKGKCRLYNAGSAPFNLLVKMYLGPLAAVIHERSLRHTSCAVGTPFGTTEKDRFLVDQFRKNFGSKCFDGDLRWFDGSHYWYVVQIMLECLLGYYHHSHHDILRKIIYNIYHPHVAIGTIIYLLKNCMPSGSFLTAEFNSIYLEIMIRLVLKSLNALQDLTFLCTYGDDFVLFLKAESHVTGSMFAQAMRDHGLHLTTTSKSEDYPDSIPFTELSFCKRVFKDNAFVLPLDHILSAGGWRKKSKLFDTGLLAIGAALFEATRYNDNLLTYRTALEHYLLHTTYTRQELIDASSVTFAHSAPQSFRPPPREISNAVHTHNLIASGDFPDAPSTSLLAACPVCPNADTASETDSNPEVDPPQDFQLFDESEEYVSALPPLDDVPAPDPDLPSPNAAPTTSSGTPSSSSSPSSPPPLLFTSTRIMFTCNDPSCSQKDTVHSHSPQWCSLCGDAISGDHTCPLEELPCSVDPSSESDTDESSDAPQDITIEEFEDLADRDFRPAVAPTVDQMIEIIRQNNPRPAPPPQGRLLQNSVNGPPVPGFHRDFYNPDQALASDFIFDDVSVILPSPTLNVIHNRPNRDLFQYFNDIVYINNAPFIRRPISGYNVPYPVWLAMEERYQHMYSYGPRGSFDFPACEFRHAIDGVLASTPDIINALSSSECVGSVVRGVHPSLSRLPNAILLADGYTWQVNYDSPIMLYARNVSTEYTDVVLRYCNRRLLPITCSLIDSVAVIVDSNNIENLINDVCLILNATPSERRRITRQLVCSHAHLIPQEDVTFFHLNAYFRMLAEILLLPIAALIDWFRYFVWVMRNVGIPAVGGMSLFLQWLLVRPFRRITRFVRSRLAALLPD